MTILCGTDFSLHAVQAVRVAGLLARASDKCLHLVHVVPSATSLPDGESALDQVARSQERLAKEADLLAPLGLRVATEVLSGRPDEVLVETADRVHADLLVVGAVGHRAIDRWLLGSCAERTAREASMPALVVRGARPFEEWLVNGRVLRVVVGCEAGPSSDAAVSWAAKLGSFGTIELLLTRMVFPGDENRRVHESGPGMGLVLSQEAEAGLLEELRGRTAPLLGDRKAQLKVLTGLGRMDRHLVMAAEELGGDLIVVGSHHREGFRRWWHGSVSSGVLHAAPMNVAIVPMRSPPRPSSEPAAARPSSG